MVNFVFVKIWNQQGWYYDEKGQLWNTAIIEWNNQLMYNIFLTHTIMAWNSKEKPNNTISCNFIYKVTKFISIGFFKALYTI